MTREEMINILKLLSTIEGFVIGKVGAFSLPDYVQEELDNAINLLAEKIKDNQWQEKKQNKKIYNVSKEDRSSPKNCIHLLYLHGCIDQIFDEHKADIKDKYKEIEKLESRVYALGNDTIVQNMEQRLISISLVINGELTSKDNVWMKKYFL